MRVARLLSRCREPKAACCLAWARALRQTNSFSTDDREAHPPRLPPAAGKARTRETTQDTAGSQQAEKKREQRRLVAISPRKSPSPKEVAVTEEEP